MTHASLFSGIGGFDLAAEWMGWENQFTCEIDEFCSRILKYHFPNSKHYGDITKTDFNEWKGKIDILTGGFPCQPFSVAGGRNGADDDRYLWPEMLRAIREIQPAWVIGENVYGIVSMVQPGSKIDVESQTSLFEASNKETLYEQEYIIETICSNIEREGYSIQPVIIPACGIGAPHQRDRVWFIANSHESRTKSLQFKREDRVYESGIITDSTSFRRRKVHKEIQSEKPNGKIINGFSNKRYVTNSNKLDGNLSRFYTSEISQKETSGIQKYKWQNFPTQSPLCSGNDGVSQRMDGITFSKWRIGSIKAYGNAIVPQVAYEIFKTIKSIEQ